LKKIGKGVAGAFGSSKYSKQKYMDTLKMLYELFTRARRDGLMALETDSDNPEGSTIFSKYPKFLADRYALAFVCDSIRMASSGGIEPFDADQMIENDMEVHHQEASTPIVSLSSVADSLPGLGIVAAVLGVVITMGSLGGPPEEIGKKVAAALVGTFLGILLCYGLVGPLAANMSKAVDDEHAYYQVLRVMIVAFMKGTAPSLAVEIGRRAIPGRVRPGFQEAEMYIKDKNSAPVAVAA
jgi:chemotaxis protein MotA